MITTVEHPEGTKLVPFEGGWKVETILEKNKWYKSQEFGNLVYYCSDEQENYGFTYVSKEWHNGLGFPLLGYTWLPASEEEVKEALIKESERRYKKGVHFKDLDDNLSKESLFEFDVYFHKNETVVRCAIPEKYWKIGNNQSNPMVFCNGKWAEIIPNPNEKILERIATIEKELEQLKAELK
jgi:hypothetical protein